MIGRVVTSGTHARTKVKLPRGDSVESVLHRFVLVYANRDQVGEVLAPDPDVVEVLLFEVWLDALRALGLKANCRPRTTEPSPDCEDDPAPSAAPMQDENAAPELVQP